MQSLGFLAVIMADPMVMVDTDMEAMASEDMDTTLAKDLLSLLLMPKLHLSQMLMP